VRGKKKNKKKKGGKGGEKKRKKTKAVHNGSALKTKTGTQKCVKNKEKQKGFGAVP